MTEQQVEAALEVLGTIADEQERHIHSPQYFDGINVLAALSYGELPAHVVARISTMLDGNGVHLERFDVLKCSGGEEVLLMKIVAKDTAS